MQKRTAALIATFVLFLTSLTIGTAVAVDGSPLPDCAPGKLCKP